MGSDPNDLYAAVTATSSAAPLKVRQSVPDSLAAVVGRSFPFLPYYMARSSNIREAHEAIFSLLAQRRQRGAIRRWGPTVTLTNLGVPFELDLRNLNDFRMFQLMTDGPGYEPGTSKLLLSGLREGSSFADIGASIGYFTLLALPRVGTTGHIWSVEPNPGAFARLTHNLALNGSPRNVESFPVALGATTGKRRLFMSRYVDSRASFTPQGKSSIEVPVRRAEEIFGGHGLDFVKIDVEGAEQAVLEGMRETLKRNPNVRVIVEWTWRYSTLELWEEIRSHFRRVMAIQERSPGTLTPVHSVSDIRFFAGNLVCDTPVLD